MMYGTKKMVRAVLYLVLSWMLRSSWSPKMTALLMLTLCTQGQEEPLTWYIRAEDGPVEKGQQVQHAQHGQDVPVDLGHEPALGGGDEGREVDELGLDMALVFAVAVIAPWHMSARRRA